MLTLVMTLALAADPAVSGTFRLDQTDSELQQIHGAAVDTTLASLPWAIRGLARSRVERVIGNCSQIGVDLQTQQLTLNCDDEPERVVELPADGVTSTNAKGEAVTTTVRASETELSVTFATGEGGVTTRYRPSGGRLLVQKTLFSPRLDEPVSWEVRYQPIP